MAHPRGKLVIIGGSVDKGSFSENTEDLKRSINFFEKGILKRITDESFRGDKSRIEIITTASSIPEIVGEEYIKAFEHLNVKNVGILDIRKREEALLEENIARIRNADTVMFTGGDQLRLTHIFGGTPFHQLLLEKYQNDNFLISGTSAGAAASSNNMIYQGKSSEALFKGEVKITGGLGFINNVIIDTHFVQRGRTGRLLYACTTNPINIGIGLGEDAGLLISNGHVMEAIGSGLIIIVDATHMKDTNVSDVEMGQPVSVENLIVHVMAIGDRYDLKERKMTIFHPKKENV
ncbi:MAG: cyanophycinase [Sphingobacteriaceae bacterium]|nr:cyanophycinase [Sphingobacteriaceae bacterium]